MVSSATYEYPDDMASRFVNSSLRPVSGTIPEKPGSYQFCDVDGKFIYVGKAKNLRNRLKQLFPGQ